MPDPTLQVGFLDDATGQPSAMRLMCVLSLVASIGCAALTLCKGDPSGNGVYFTGMFLTAAFAGKVTQKAIETKAP